MDRVGQPVGTSYLMPGPWPEEGDQFDAATNNQEQERAGDPTVAATGEQSSGAEHAVQGDNPQQAASGHAPAAPPEVEGQAAGNGQHLPVGGPQASNNAWEVYGSIKPSLDGRQYHFRGNAIPVQAGIVTRTQALLGGASAGQAALHSTGIAPQLCGNTGALQGESPAPGAQTGTASTSRDFGSTVLPQDPPPGMEVTRLAKGQELPVNEDFPVNSYHGDITSPLAVRLQPGDRLEIVTVKSDFIIYNEGGHYDIRNVEGSVHSRHSQGTGNIENVDTRGKAKFSNSQLGSSEMVKYNEGYVKIYDAQGRHVVRINNTKVDVGKPKHVKDTDMGPVEKPAREGITSGWKTFLWRRMPGSVAIEHNYGKANQRFAKGVSLPNTLNLGQDVERPLRSQAAGHPVVFNETGPADIHNTLAHATGFNGIGGIAEAASTLGIGTIVTANAVGLFNGVRTVQGAGAAAPPADTTTAQGSGHAAATPAVQRMGIGLSSGGQGGLSGSSAPRVTTTIDPRLKF